MGYRGVDKVDHRGVITRVGTPGGSLEISRKLVAIAELSELSKTPEVD